MPDFPTPTQTARYVVTHPEAFHDQPAVLASMWGTLIEARGGTARLERLGPPAHHVVAKVAKRANPEADRIRALVREIAQRKGYLPPSNGVPA